jgi:hypothetical protein
MTDIVERFEHDPYDPYNMIRDPRDGEWVRYSDFAALSAKLAEAERQLVDADKRAERHYRGWAAQQSRAEASEARVAELSKVLAEAVVKVENDRTMWNGEWQVWLLDARAALAATKETKP